MTGLVLESRLQDVPERVLQMYLENTFTVISDTEI